MELAKWRKPTTGRIDKLGLRTLTKDSTPEEIQTELDFERRNLEDLKHELKKFARRKIGHRLNIKRDIKESELRIWRLELSLGIEKKPKKGK